MKLDLSSLEKAIKSLEEALLEYKKDLKNRFVRDASIQRFEYTYELTHKMLKRYLEMSEPSAEVIEEMSFPQLIRTGSEKGLLKNAWPTWRKYRDARNMTSHTYDEKKAYEVFEVVPLFLKDAQYLLDQLKKRP